jgi:hypothetical protein
MWFADAGNIREIGRITPSGQITEFSAGLQASNSSLPTDIAAGADGNMWFIDSGTAREIGLIGAGAPAASIAAPSVSGSGQQGTQQVCHGDRWSDWAGQQPVPSTIPGFPAYQWSRDGTAIAAASSRSYTPAADDVGGALTCTVSVTYALLGATETATSAAVIVIPQSSGPTGQTGTTGQTGPAGPRGPAGKVELVTCKTVTTKHKRGHHTAHAAKEKCTTKLVTGPVKFKIAQTGTRATLSRAGVVYATGYAHRTRSGLQTSLVAARKLAHGRYLLALTSSHGSRATTSRQQVTLR